jgi:hypothetical protein
MKEFPEYKIAEVFWEKDRQVKFRNKENLWKRIESEKNDVRLVPLFWKVAAIFFVFMLAGSVFAHIYLQSENSGRLKAMEFKNSLLQNKLDSLLKLVPETVTEIRYIEKEKLVYKPEISSRVKALELIEENKNLVKNNNKLQSEIEAVTINFNKEIDSLKRQLALVFETKKERVQDQKNQQKDSLINRPQFLFNPSAVENQLQKPYINTTPKLEIKIFQNPMNERNIDPNTSILINK